MNLKITNRDLLRDYKSLKNRLMRGEIQHIFIPQDSDISLKLSIHKKKPKEHSADYFFDRLKKHPSLYKGLKRPEEDII